MKGLSNREFEKLISELQSLVGYRFQELGERKSQFLLNFWGSEQGIRSWLLDLDPRRPLLLEMPEAQKARSPVKKKPITLFIKAHFEGRILNAVHWNSANGRVFTMDFGEGYSLEFRVYTGGANWIATTPEKSLSLKKPMELKELEWEYGAGSDRELSELYQQAFQSQPKARDVSDLDPEKHKKKMEKAIAKLEEDIQIKRSKDWNSEGQALLAEGKTGEAQKAFQKSKDMKAKLERAEARLVELKKELEAGPKTRQVKSKMAPKVDSGVKGRTKTLSSGHSLFVGKNASDNLKILRSASSWDYWLHLRDYPGAHGIVRRNKKEKIPQAVFIEAARALVLAHLKKKSSELSGERFDVLLAEVRFVRPIKGDKLGRVNYSNEMTLSVAMS